MKTKLAITVAVAALAAGTIYASADTSEDGYYGKGFRHMGTRMFDRTDANGDGALTVEEMSARIEARFADADSDGDARITKAEIIDAIERNVERSRFKRHSGTMADRLVYRFDIDDDGVVSQAEIDNRVAKVFALMDFNDDGRVEKSEIRRSMPSRHHHKGRFHRIKSWWNGDGAEQGERDE